MNTLKIFVCLYILVLNGVNDDCEFFVLNCEHYTVSQIVPLSICL